jgi:flagellar hook-associated protein 1 FlgK
MSKVSAMMGTSAGALKNAQTSLQTVAHNIANKNVEGATRQRVEQVTNPSVGQGNLRIGTGARAAQVTRVTNPYIDKQIQREGMTQGYIDSRADGLSRVEQVFNEQNTKGINQYVTDFFNSFRELSNNPESLTSRTMVRETGEAMVTDFHRVHDQLTGIQGDINTQVKAHVEQINQFTKEIASLNEKIQAIEMQGSPANDERDRRDLLLKKLNEKINISVAESKDGLVSITAGQSAILVSGLSSMDLKALKLPDQDKYNIFYSNSENTIQTDVTKQLKGGQVGGALSIRDEVIEGLLNNMDEMAYTLADRVNEAHVEGFDRNGREGAEFFAPMNDSKDASKNLKVSFDILNDVSKICAGVHPNAPGDNTVANVISGLQYKPIMSDGEATIDDFYSANVGQVGILAQRAIKSQDAQKNIVAQLDKIRESISGVSLDEETTKMIEFQKAYDASARMIKTADEMLDTVLNLKRM